MALSVIFDHAQRRLKHDRIAVLAGGDDLNGPYYQDTWIDPVTRTTILRPAPLYPDWWTSNTGIFEKLGPAALTAEVADNWYTVADYKLADVAAGPWIASKGAAPGALVTNTTWGKNRAFALSMFSYGAGDKFILSEFGWNPNPNYLESLGHRLWSDGELEIWKNAVQVGLYNLSGALVADQKTNVALDLMLIPCRRRELLVVSRQGNGFSHVFDDIDEDDEDPIITPASKFWVSFPHAKAQVQIAPIQFPSTGYVTSVDYQLGEAPAGSDVLEQSDNKDFAGGTNKNWRIFGDPPYAGAIPGDTKAELIKPDNTGLFIANGTNKDCRLKVTLAGDGSYTPFVYAAEVAYARVVDETDASEETPVDDFLEELAIDVPDDPTGVSMRTQLLRPEEIESTIVAGLKRINNRPAKLERETVVWIDAQGESPSWEMSTSDDTQRLTLEFRDRWKSLENYRFKTRVPLDGWNIVDALAFILKSSGLEDTDLDLEAIDFEIEPIPGPEAGEFNVVIEIGDTAAEWVLQLMDDYAATYHYGFKPTAGGYKFVLKSDATLSAAPVAFELWSTRQGAIDGGIPDADVWKYVFRDYSEDTLPGEANDIRVTGWDPRQKRAIQSHYPDTEAMKVDTAPSARPENWCGEPLLYGLVNAGITTQDVCDRAAELLFDRLTPIKVVAEITCEAMIKPDEVPVWRGDDVWLHGKGRFRVISMSVDFTKEPATGDEWQWREATYCLERKVESSD